MYNSAAPEVELFLNGVSQGRKNAGKENRYTAVFEIAYEKGELRAVSIGEDQREISEAKIVSTGRPAAVRLVPEKTALSSDGESLPMWRWNWWTIRAMWCPTRRFP